MTEPESALALIVPPSFPSCSQAGVAISYLKSASIHGRALDLQRSKHYNVLMPIARHEMCLFKQYALSRQPNGGRPPKLVHAPCRTLFYFNAPPRMAESAVRDLLISVKCRLPLAITVINNENEAYAGGGRGGRPSCGFLDYPDISSATDVIMHMNNTEYNGFTFRVAYASKERMPDSAVQAALSSRAAAGEDDYSAGQKRRRSPSYERKPSRSFDRDGENLLSEPERAMREGYEDSAIDRNTSEPDSLHGELPSLVDSKEAEVSATAPAIGDAGTIDDVTVPVALDDHAPKSE